MSERITNIEFFRSNFSYDPITGYVTRLVNMSKWVAGERAGRTRTDGYRYITIDGNRYLEHRICWLLHYGEWPKEQLDHINLDRSDNRIENLRSASQSENNRNHGKQSNNTSGYKGVTFNKHAGKYQAKIMVSKVCHSLGYFHNPEDASAAYNKAAKELHGEFCNIN